MINTILNERYQVQKLLREKAGRKTLLALDLTTQELVVVKLLVLNNQFVWDDLKLFEREAQTLQLLSHSAIPQYLDYFELDLPEYKGFALVQTYLDAPCLQESFDQGRRFTEGELKEIARKLLNILTYLHEHHPPVIHRDIKPSNILLTNRSGNSVGDVYLVDFGSVQNVLANDDGTITIVGTYGYMPIEQFSGQTTPASDIYSLGATLIYLAAGRHPSELLKKQIRITFEDQVNLSDSFIQWLKLMTEPALDMRFTSAKSAIATLDNPITIKPENSANTLQKPFGSEVRITNDKDKLEIVIPPKYTLLSMLTPGIIISGIKTSMRVAPISTISFLIVAGVPGLMMILLYIYYNPSLLFYVLLFYGIWVGTVIWSNKQTRLRITAENIIVTEELNLTLFWYRYRSLYAIPEQITAIEHTLLAYLQQGKDETERTVTIVPKINLCLGTRDKFTLVTEEQLSTPELHWLAQEISDWLKIPIIRN